MSFYFRETIVHQMRGFFSLMLREREVENAVNFVSEKDDQLIIKHFFIHFLDYFQSDIHALILHSDDRDTAKELLLVLYRRR